MPNIEEKVMIMPDRDEFLARLKAVDDDAYLVERLYPIILQSAGKRLVSQGILLMFTLAMYDYAEGLPPVMQGLMFARIPSYIMGVVVDEEIQADALRLYRESMASARSSR